MFIDVGCQRRISDGGVYNNSSLSNATENNLLDLPPPRPLPISEDPEWVHDYETERFPVVIVVDDAFPLKSQIIKPYSHRNLTFRKSVEVFSVKYQYIYCIFETFMTLNCGKKCQQK